MISINFAPVEGGKIAFTTFGNPTAESVIYAPHGITANMLTWAALADQLPESYIIAPDLRGRGRSNQLGAPYGLKQHAKDALAILNHLGVESYHIVGHSMGAFVSVHLAALDARRVQSVVLVDGGLPLVRPEGVSDENLVRATLGPAAQRLEMLFESDLQYLDFWRQHPAFERAWSELVEQYLRHDLTRLNGSFKPSASIPAVAADIIELFGPEDYKQAMTAIEAPIVFIRAPRGLMDAEPLYGQDLTRHSIERFSDFKAVEAEDINHYTILLSTQGAKQVAEVFVNQVNSLRKVVS